jgi:hypothetical protein
MGGIFLAFGLVSGIISLAWRQAENPTFKRFLMKKRLEAIAAVPDSKLDIRGAEDGLALARRLEQPKLVTRFEALVTSLKRRTR